MPNDYTILISPTGRRSLKRLPQQIQKSLLEKAAHLKADPLQGEKLKGALSFLRSLHTRMNKADYRIAYEIIAHQTTIVIHYIASRENFYKELARLHLKPLKATT